MTNREKPYGGSSRQRLVDLINVTNGSTLVEGIDFEYGAMYPSSNKVGSNTRIVLQSLRDDRVDTEIHYTRLGIDVLAHLPSEFVHEVLVDALPFSIHQKLDEINEALGLDLTPEEVINTYFTDERSEYPLHIAPDKSVAWIDSVFNFKVTTAFDLTQVFPNKVLNGLTPPASVNNSP